MLRVAPAWVLVALTSLASPASAADWLAVYNADEFDGKHRYLAITSASLPSFGFVCEAETGRIKLLFRTNEPVSRSLSKSMPIHFNQIVLIVDDDPVRSYSATVDEIDRKLIAQSYEASVIELAGIISTAKRRVLIAVEMYGKKYFREEFPVAGSGRAIQMLLKACPKK